MRYVIVAFFFMGLAFYELSGGADFDPDATRLSRIEAPVAVAPETSDDVLAEAAPALPENVTRIALDLNAVQDVIDPTRDRSRPAGAETSTPVTVSEAPPAEVLPSLVGDTVLETPNLIDSSVITSVDFDLRQPVLLPTRAAPAAQAPAERADIRSVTGTAVNVRGGPGTNFSVVNRLVLGDEVEVLQDTGEGWVRLRPLDGSPSGWMAAFLLTEG